MGYYINPKDMTKEAWLAQHGKPSSTPPPFSVAEQGELPVCLVQNALFSAAGVCFSEQELAAWKAPDPRPRQWFTASIADLKAVGALPESFNIPEFASER